MSAAKKLERMPEELFLEQAFKDGRATKTRLSMKALGKPDIRFQARVEHLNLDHVSRLQAMLQDMGDTFPCVVFMKGGTYFLADGFHRHEAYLRAKRKDIPAYLIQSDDPEREALEYCTMCNRLALKTRNKEDVDKAIKMLFTIDSWWIKCDVTVAAHVGCYPAKVKSIRSKLVLDGAREPIAYVEQVDGRQRPTGFKQKGESYISKSTSKRGYTMYYARANDGKRIQYADRAKVEEALAADGTAKANRRININKAEQRILNGMGFDGMFNDCARQYPGLRAYHRKGIVCIACDFAGNQLLPAIIGQLIAARRYKGDLGARMIVLCYPEDGPAKVIDLYKQEAFEFLTPEELIESLKEATPDEG